MLPLCFHFVASSLFPDGVGFDLAFPFLTVQRTAVVILVRGKCIRIDTEYPFMGAKRLIANLYIMAGTLFNIVEADELLRRLTVSAPRRGK
jgi:hypothetical protein